MALRATVFKALLNVADLDRGYYADHPLTLARHPSETDERMMVRLLAYAHLATPGLAFGQGLSTVDEADLILRSDAGDIEHWIEVGLPDERVVAKARGRAKCVSIYAYGGNAASLWWTANAPRLGRFANLRVWRVPEAASKVLAGWADRGMDLQATIDGGQVMFSRDGEHLVVDLELLQDFATR